MPSLKIRVAAAVAALVVAASTGASISSPALAEEPQLALSYSSTGNISASDELIGAYAYNWGDEPVSDVTLTFDTSGLRDVEVSVSSWNELCQLADKIVTCHLAGLAAKQTRHVSVFQLKSKPQAKPGPAGTLQGAIHGFGGDGAEYNGSGDLAITILESGPDLVAVTEDLSTANNPVGGGDVRPIAAAIYNDGDTPTGDWFVRIHLPTGAGIVEQYSDCEYQDWWPGEHPEGYVYGPHTVTCAAPSDLDPLGVGEEIVFADENGESLFHAAFGKNLQGPNESYGYVEVGLVEDLESTRALRSEARKGSSGKTFAGAVAKLKPSIRAASRREANTSNNWASFAIWTKPNLHDFAVSAQPVSGKIGDIVEIPYTVINNGPSDGGGSWKFTAPTGTVLVNGYDDSNPPWCYFMDEEGNPVKELPEVRCGIEGEFPAKASGFQGVSAKIKLRIVSTPGDDGTLRFLPYPENTDPNPANDEVKLVVTISDGALPITGANVALISGIGAGVVAIGAALFFLARRRRFVTVSE